MMNIRPWLPAAFVLMLGCSAENPAQSQSPTPLGTDTVATVNGEPVYESVFRSYVLGRTQMPADDLTEQQHEAVLDELVQLYVLAQAGEAAGVGDERNIAAQMELQRLNLLARTQVTRYQEENAPTELELREAYEANLEQLSAPEYKARHILLENESDAAAVIAELDAGADFSELAKQKSTGPSGPKGGDLGWFDGGSMVAPFSEAVSKMTKGSYSETPVQTRFGFHVILLEDTKEGQAPGLEAVRDEMNTSVIQEKIQAYVEGLKDTATIVATETPAAVAE
jgi:peptidyl-prolyl cis-trans isomerase C